MQKKKLYILTIVATFALVSTTAMTQAYAQSVSDGMDGYVKGTSGIYTGNPHECWYADEDGNMLPCRIDTGDTAWMLTATSFVLLMSPGVAVFLWWISKKQK